jgi:glycosyltransferase involved in cell wall biosynthesis
MTGRVLLTVSGTVPPDLGRQVAEGSRPQPDYVALAEAMSADTMDVTAARMYTGRLGAVLERLGGAGLLLAWACFRARRDYDTIVTDGEQVGLPLSLLLKLRRRSAPVHVMVVHILSAPKKVRLYRLFRLGRRIDAMIVYSSWQERFARERLGFPADRILRSPFMVDTRFFGLERVTADRRRMICAAGLERRDYQTLLEAVEGLDVRVVIAAASPWSRRPDGTRGALLPDNVETCSLGFVDLRQLYADAQLVVMPLEDVEFQAGITTILEAMAMERAVICTQTRGQTDVVVDGANGLYVPPGDSGALRAAITKLLDQPRLAAEMGKAGRAFAERECDVKIYARRIAGAVAAAGGNGA